MQSKIPSNLLANIEQVRPAPDKQYTKYYLEAITFNLSNKESHLWNDMITVLSANFTQISATQTEFWCRYPDVNCTIKSTQNQIRASAQQNDIRWCQKCSKPGAIGKTERGLLKGYELKTNYVKNTTSVSSCDLEKVTPTKYPNQKYVQGK